MTEDRQVISMNRDLKVSVKEEVTVLIQTETSKEEQVQINPHYFDPFRGTCSWNHRKCPLVMGEFVWDSKTVRLVRLAILDA